MLSRLQSEILDAIFGICVGVVAVCVAGAAFYGLPIVNPICWCIVPTAIILIVGSFISGGLLTGILLRNSRRIILIYASVSIILAYSLTWFRDIWSNWSWMIAIFLALAPAGLFLSQINIRRWHAVKIPRVISIIYLVLVLSIGLCGAYIAAPFFITQHDNASIQFRTSTTAVYALAALVVVLRLRKLIDGFALDAAMME